MSIFFRHKNKKDDMVDKDDDDEKREHEPTDAEITMKALQGLGAYEDDEDDAALEEDAKKEEGSDKPK